MKKVEIRENGTRRVYTDNSIPSKTDQSFKEECDVNNIITRYKKTGQLTHLARTQGKYADVSEMKDLQESFQTVAQARDTFETLPAELRKKLNNDPVQLMEYLSNPENDDEAIRYGLKEKRNPELSEPVPEVTKPKGRGSKQTTQKTTPVETPPNDDE
jgi:phage internal scaffolding protein